MNVGKTQVLLAFLVHPWSIYLRVYLHVYHHHHCFAIKQAQTFLFFSIHFCVCCCHVSDVDHSWINMVVLCPPLTFHYGCCHLGMKVHHAKVNNTQEGLSFTIVGNTHAPQQLKKASMHLSLFFATLNFHHQILGECMFFFLFAIFTFLCQSSLECTFDF